MSSGQPYRYNGNGKAYQVNLLERQALRLVQQGEVTASLVAPYKTQLPAEHFQAGMRVTPDSHPPNGSELRSKPFHNQFVRIDS